MKVYAVKTGCFTPRFKNTSLTCIKYLSFSFAVFGLSGCFASTKDFRMAPAPPELRFSSLYNQQQSSAATLYLTDPAGAKERERLVPKDIITQVATVIDTAQVVTKSLTSEEKSTRKCRIQHRFDRKAMLAYEWDRSRIALDVNGINIGGSDDDQGFRLEYRIKLSPEKTKVEKCRYASRWQGLIGSSYNEFFIREEDTVWQELREIRNDVTHYIDDAF
jgi:hypothetical protein